MQLQESFRMVFILYFAYQMNTAVKIRLGCHFQDADGFLTTYLTETILRIGFNAADYMSKQLESFLKRHSTPSLDNRRQRIRATCNRSDLRFEFVLSFELVRIENQ
eukprot:scaffold16422_cov78-Skeletonema_dohrnii-CCMP3373.AAC.5